jgi:hypothetical protein
MKRLTIALTLLLALAVCGRTASAARPRWYRGFRPLYYGYGLGYPVYGYRYGYRGFRAGYGYGGGPIFDAQAFGYSTYGF